MALKDTLEMKVAVMWLEWTHHLKEAEGHFSWAEKQQQQQKPNPQTKAVILAWYFLFCSFRAEINESEEQIKSLFFFFLDTIISVL